MKKLSKIFSAGLSLTLCAALVVPSFAASFTELQNVIDTKESLVDEETNETRISYANGTVTLYEDVVYGSGDEVKDLSTITIGHGTNVTLDLNGYDVDGGARFDVNEETLEATVTDKGSGSSVITINSRGTLTLKDDSEGGDGTITGGNNDMGGGIRNLGTFIMNSGVISGNIGNVGGGVQSNGKFEMTGGAIESNSARVCGGGVHVYHGSFTMSGDAAVKGNSTSAHDGGICSDHGTVAIKDNATVENNKSKDQTGGIHNAGGTLYLQGGSVSGNESGLHGGGVFSELGGKIVITGGVLSGNTAGTVGDDIYATSNTALSDSSGQWTYDNSEDRQEDAEERMYDIPEDGKFSSNTGLKAHIHSYTAEVTAQPTCTEEGETTYTCICGDGYTEPIDTLGHDMGEWVLTTPPQIGVPGEETRVCSRSDLIETRLVPALTVSTSTETEIDDVDVPLSGIFTRADAIGYLWEQEGSPDWELSEFPDVPGDHQWAVAIGWAEDMGIALPDLEGNFRPDDLVLRYVEDLEIDPEGEFEEFLNRFAVYAGIELEDDELFYELGGVADDIVMGEEAQEIFDAFFAKLEAALRQAA